MTSRAALIAIGSELLGPRRQDTNALWLTEQLESVGIEVVRKACVGDDEQEIALELSFALARAPLVLATGGLGPTGDDRTREAAARAFGLRLTRDELILQALRQRFARRGLEMPSVNEKQALVLEGSRVIENRRGSAPGVWLERDGALIVLLPGVPVEMREMFEHRVLPEAAQRFGAARRYRRILKIAAMGESAVEERVAPVYARWPEHSFTILSSVGEVQLHLSASGTEEEAHRTLDAQSRDFEEALPGLIFGRDEDTLEKAVGGLLRAGGKTLAVAESCTGGLVGGRVTEVPGSSDYFLGGLISYADFAKEKFLGVSRELLILHGAVSEEVSRAMAEGAARGFGADFGLAVTGIAGPGGGSAEKPVGTVWIALSQKGKETESRRLRLPGDRRSVRTWAGATALEMLRRRLAGAAHA
jgi:nicotinamide-nucleotide amidase